MLEVDSGECGFRINKRRKKKNLVRYKAKKKKIYLKFKKIFFFGKLILLKNFLKFELNFSSKYLCSSYFFTISRKKNVFFYFVFLL